MGIGGMFNDSSCKYPNKNKLVTRNYTTRHSCITVTADSMAGGGRHSQLSLRIPAHFAKRNVLDVTNIERRDFLECGILFQSHPTTTRSKSKSSNYKVRSKPKCDFFNRQNNLSSLSTDPTSQLNVFGHDGHSLSMDGAQVGIFEQTDQVSFRGFLQKQQPVSKRTTRSRKSIEITTQNQAINLYLKSHDSR